MRQYFCTSGLGIFDDLDSTDSSGGQTPFDTQLISWTTAGVVMFSVSLVLEISKLIRLQTLSSRGSCLKYSLSSFMFMRQVSWRCTSITSSWYSPPNCCFVQFCLNCIIRFHVYCVFQYLTLQINLQTRIRKLRLFQNVLFFIFRALEFYIQYKIKKKQINFYSKSPSRKFQDSYSSSVSYLMSTIMIDILLLRCTL